MAANGKPTQARVSYVIPPFVDAAMHHEPSPLEMLERAARYSAGDMTGQGIGYADSSKVLRGGHGASSAARTIAQASSGVFP